MEALASAIGGMAVGAAAWIGTNVAGAILYGLAALLLFPVILAGVLLARAVGNVRRRLRGEPVKAFRWR